MLVSLIEATRSRPGIADNQTAQRIVRSPAASFRNLRSSAFIGGPSQ